MPPKTINKMAGRLTPQLRRRVMELPLQDRVTLIECLRVSLKTLEGGRLERLNTLADRLADVTGTDVRTNTRSYGDTPWHRAIFCLVAFREGYSQNQIGHFIHRDHSSVSQAITRMQNAFDVPRAYVDIIKLYNDYVEQIMPKINEN